MADIIKFYYKTMLGNKNSTLIATSTSSEENDIKNIYKMTERTMWKASIENHTSSQYLTQDNGTN